MAGTGHTPLRKDAARNRAAILDAARELFAGSRDVPMYEIARRAGVGQPTLYRHFSDRSAVVAALGREHVERMEAIAAEHRDEPDALLVVLQAAADGAVAMHGLVGVLREDTTLAPVLRELRARMIAVLDSALASAPKAQFRPDLDVADLVVVLNMVTGALGGVDDPAERASASRRALEIALGGIRARSA